MRRLSAYEAGANAVVGLLVSALAVQLIFPLLGWPVTPAKSGGVAVFFFTLSFVRSYALRRLFSNLSETDGPSDKLPRPSLPLTTKSEAN